MRPVWSHRLQLRIAGRKKLFDKAEAKACEVPREYGLSEAAVEAELMRARRRERLD